MKAASISGRMGISREKIFSWIIMRQQTDRRLYPLFRMVSSISGRFINWEETIPMFSRVEFEINSECNRKCGYCPNSTHERKHKGLMDMKLFRKCIDEMSRIKYRGMISYHFYGEPLLDPRLGEFVEYASGKCPGSRSFIFTNGDFLDVKKFRDLASRGVSHFIVTQHDGALNGVMKKTMSALKADERKMIEIKYLRDDCLINRGGSVASVKNNADNADSSKTPCMLPCINMIITVNGNVLPCCNDFFEKQSMGNVSEKGIIEIWNSDKFRRFRSDLRAGKRSEYSPCSECDYNGYTFQQLPENLKRERTRKVA